MDDKLTAEGFQRLTAVSRETLGRLRVYLRLLEKWQRTINLVSTRSLEDAWRRHMLDSAQLARYIPSRGGGGAGGAPVIVDIGSGAGFPGLVLAIMGASDLAWCIWWSPTGANARSSRRWPGKQTPR